MLKYRSYAALLYNGLTNKLLLLSPIKKQVDNAFRHQYSAQNFYPSAEPTLSLGYGPAYDAPRESSPVQQGPKNGVNKNVSDVLRALQMAKANIQSGSKVSKEQRSATSSSDNSSVSC